MIVLTFHTKHATWQTNPHPIGGLKALASELIPLFVESIRMAMPSAKIHLITDKTSQFGNDFDFVHRFSIDQDKLMLERLRCQISVLEQLPTTEQVCLLDTDTLILKPLRHIFAYDFDVAVTIRDKPRLHFEFTMPYNNGVIFVNLKNRNAVLAYFQAVMSETEKMPAKYHAWSGNQFAVRKLLGTCESNRTLRIANTKVRVLPCSSFNFTPVSDSDALDGVFILHFRGDAKPLMERYAGRVGIR